MKSSLVYPTLLIASVVSAGALWFVGTGAADRPQTYQRFTAIQWHKKLVTQRVTYNHRINHYGETVRNLRRQLKLKLSSVGASPLERAFLCIHSYEGSWTDSGGPYYGGMQMDLSFARTYGPEFYKKWGTPDHWPISVQMAVAIRAHISGRGFYPWPNTARFCGLL